MLGDLAPRSVSPVDIQRAHQRERILAATIAVVADEGLAAASIAKVASRARVSRRTFDAHFAGLDEALAAVIDDALAQVTALARRALSRQGSWRDSVRHGLADVLVYFDCRRSLARVLLVETLTASPRLLAHRREAIETFRDLFAEEISRKRAHPSPLAAEGALASVMGVLYTRLTEPDRRPLTELVGPLMGVLVAAASDAPEIATEVRRGAELVDALGLSVDTEGDAPAFERDALPASLRDPRAFRLRQCLLYVVAHPEASNRDIGDRVGIAHRGQLSTLLEKLARMGLLVKTQGQPGQANSWRASAEGRQVACRLQSDPLLSTVALSSRDGFICRAPGESSMAS